MNLLTATLKIKAFLLSAVDRKTFICDHGARWKPAELIAKGKLFTDHCDTDCLCGVLTFIVTMFTLTFGFTAVSFGGVLPFVVRPRPSSASADVHSCEASLEERVLHTSRTSNPSRD